MDADLAALEQKISSLIAHAGELRSANQTLQQALSAAEREKLALSQRMRQATSRLDALLDRMPEN